MKSRNLKVQKEEVRPEEDQELLEFLKQLPLEELLYLHRVIAVQIVSGCKLESAPNQFN